MANLFDYLLWRGDLSLDASPFNEIDAMLLSRFSYMPFEYVPEVATTCGASIGVISSQLLALPELEKKLLFKGDLRLLKALSVTQRFQDIHISRYVNQINNETQTQFSAISIQLDEGRQFIAFRGTDDTLVGWKENFNMSFVCPVPAQERAVEYLETVATQTNCSLILGGHSKGGNLAVYAAAFCAPEVQSHITAVYNFDGPGFDEKILQKQGYQAICSHVYTYVPQSSIVGMLLGHEEKYTIVHSSESTGIWQHDTYSWEVERDHFVYLESVDHSSKFIDDTLKSWVASLDYHQREQLVDALYIVMTQTQAETMRELSENWFSNAITVIKSLKNLDDDTRKLVTETLRLLIRTSRKEALQMILK